ncbi:2037_t:CDS:2, partial [Scutellospora calospora]
MNILSLSQPYNQDCGLNSPPHPKQIIGYFPAYKSDNNNNVTAYQNIISSITHLYYIAFSPTDLIGMKPYQVFQNQLLTFNQTKANISGNILLPADNNLIQLPPFANVLNGGRYNSNDSATQNFINDLVKIVNDYSFYGIDIDYPNKLPCFQFNNNIIDSFFIPFLTDISNKLKQSSKILTVTAGQYPINGINSDIISFVNIQAFRLNINTTHFSAGLDDIQTIFNNWSNKIDRNKLILGIELGGIIEAIKSHSSNVAMDIFNQDFTISRKDITFPLSVDENIKDPCALSPYGRVSWNTLSAFLLPPCYKNINTTNSQQWNYNFNDFQSLSAKLGFMQNNDLAGIAISDITKDSQFANFILGNITPSTSTPPSSQSNVGVIVGSIIGSVVFVSVLVASGFILYRRNRVGKGNVKTTVVAMFDYVGKEENDLSFKAGDLIEVLERGDGPNDWWVGRLHGIIGEFP